MRTFFLSLLLASPALLCAQAYEGRPCDLKANPGLKALVIDGSLDEGRLYDGPSGLFDQWSTSLLKPSGTAPPNPQDYDNLDFETEEPMAEAYDAWSCMYSAHAAMDGDPKTAWVEGVNGHGIGEVLLIGGLDPGFPMEIWAGYGKSPALHKNNSRPKKLRIHLVMPGYVDVTQNGYVFGQLRVVHSEVVSLADLNAYQPLQVSERFYSAVERTLISELPEPHSTWKRADLGSFPLLIALEVLEVYPGAKWDDLCISEVRNKPGEK